MKPLVMEALPGAALELSRALAEAGLPVADLAMPGRQFFRARDDAGAVVGYVGWETLGASALLRSLVVLPGRRGEGFGRALAEWSLAQVAAAGFADAWILTTTAAGLAERLGFVDVPRDQAPDHIRASRQFTSLCPCSARCLRKVLA